MIVMLNEEYITKKDEKYLIKRKFDGIEYFFGEFLTINEAISKKEWLDAHGWPVSLEVSEKIELIDSSKDAPSFNIGLTKSYEDEFPIYDPLKFNCNTQNRSYEQDILDMVYEVQFIKEDSKIPFPQSDDLNRFIFIGQCLLKKDLSKEEMRRYNQIGNRIVNMYTSTGFYFHVFDKYKKDNKIYYKLSDKGKDIFESNEYDRNLKICKCIFEHEILYKIFMDSLVNENISKTNIVNIMLQYDLNLKSMVTIERRAQCISSWMHWIFRLMNIEI